MYDNFFKTWRGGAGANCPMSTEIPFLNRPFPPARKKFLFNVQWDLGADWLVLSKTETGEPLPPLHVCIVHPFNVQFQIALAIIFAKRPADCTLNSTVWLNQNWHIVQCAVLDGAKMSSESASRIVFTSGLRLTPTPREWSGFLVTH